MDLVCVLQGQSQVVLPLQPKPEIHVIAEGLGQTDRHFGRDPGFLVEEVTQVWTADAVGATIKVQSPVSYTPAARSPAGAAVPFRDSNLLVLSSFAGGPAWAAG